MTNEIALDLPPVVNEAYNIEESARLTQLSGGLVNETLLVEQGNRSFVLRRLAPMLGASTVRDTCIIGSHLKSAGWEAPTIEPTVYGTAYIFDAQQRIWHGMHFIDSDNRVPDTYDDKLALQVGHVLGGWHAAVRPLSHEPDSLPHFHDTEHIARKLRSELSELDSEDAQNLGRLFLHDYSLQTHTDLTKPQIIHGDPKLDNMLYRDTKPFTLIDFDCVMQDSVWTDVGDFLRSLSGKIIHTEEKPEELFGAFIQGYLEANESRLSFDEALLRALHATRRIACELGMRYLSDIVDGQQYFSWNKTVFTSRSEALLSKSWTQYRILMMIQQTLNEGN